MMKITRLSICIILFTLANFPLLGAEKGKAEYRQAKKLAQAKKYDVAYAKFRMLARKFPDSPYREQSLFALGEYYYKIRAYQEALAAFSEHLTLYPEAENHDLVQIYLLKILDEMKLKSRKKDELIEKLRKNLASAPMLLLFSEYKETKYLSPLNNFYCIRYYLDRIEVYANDEIFTSITF